jgi:hypothetical protein
MKSWGVTLIWFAVALTFAGVLSSVNPVLGGFSIILVILGVIVFLGAAAVKKARR